MKIAFIVGAFPALSETFILNQITGLIDLGHEVDVYSRMTPSQGKVHPDVEKYNLYARTYYLNDVPENKIKRILKAIKIFAINFHKSPLTILKSINIFKYGREALSLYLFYHAVAFLRKQYDIIHCHFGPNGNFGALLKELGIGGKLVVMFHGYDIRAGIQKRGSIYNRLFEFSDCILSISDYNHNNLISFGADPRKVVFHPVGIDVNKFSYLRESGKLDQPKPIIILTVARLVYEKGLQYGIQAISELLEQKPNLSLEYHIIGGGQLEEELRKLVEDLSLGKIVRFLGPMEQEEVIQAMRQAHIFLLPSVAEALPVVLMEAQAVGLSVVATNVGNVSQAIIDGVSGFLVPERDVDALAEKLEYLILHPEVWPKMGRDGRKYVEDHYDIKKLNQRLVKIYEDLLFGTY